MAELVTERGWEEVCSTGAIERGEKDLRLTTLVKLANTFKISISQLLK
jgi:hypothetical protein